MGPSLIGWVREYQEHIRYGYEEIEGMNGPVARWPRRGHFARCSGPIWGKFQIDELWWMI